MFDIPLPVKIHLRPELTEEEVAVSRYVEEPSRSGLYSSRYLDIAFRSIDCLEITGQLPLASFPLSNGRGKTMERYLTLAGLFGGRFRGPHCDRFPTR